MESISVNKDLGIALRILNCPSENIDGESSTLVIGCRTCMQGCVFFNCGGLWRTCAGIRWLDSPEISTTNFSMFAFRNCLLRTMPRELNQGYRVNSASSCYLKKDQHKPIVAVGVSESCQIRHNMKTFGANGTSPTRCHQATASEHKRWRADECERVRDSRSCDSERKDTKQARAVYNG